MEGNVEGWNKEEGVKSIEGECRSKMRSAGR